MSMILIIINLVTLSFSISSLALIIYLIRLYDYTILKQIRNILLLLIISYGAGIFFNFPGSEELLKEAKNLNLFLFFQSLLISCMIYMLLFNFLHHYTGHGEKWIQKTCLLYPIPASADGGNHPQPRHKSKSLRSPYFPSALFVHPHLLYKKGHRIAGNRFYKTSKRFQYGL